jgi:hypothetical protein
LPATPRSTFADMRRSEAPLPNDASGRRTGECARLCGLPVARPSARQSTVHESGCPPAPRGCCAGNDSSTRFSSGSGLGR